MNMKSRVSTQEGQRYRLSAASNFPTICLNPKKTKFNYFVDSQRNPDRFQNGASKILKSAEDQFY